MIQCFELLDKSLFLLEKRGAKVQWNFGDRHMFVPPLHGRESPHGSYIQTDHSSYARACGQHL